MYSSLFVTFMGIGTVFFGLTCIIFLTMAMGWVLRNKDEKTPAAPAVPASSAPDPELQSMQAEIVAAITAVLSGESGIPVCTMNIVNISKI